jgi:hypothetical protein
MTLTSDWRAVANALTVGASWPSEKHPIRKAKNVCRHTHKEEGEGRRVRGRKGRGIRGGKGEEGWRLLQ